MLKLTSEVLWKVVGNGQVSGQIMGRKPYRPDHRGSSLWSHWSILKKKIQICITERQLQRGRERVEARVKRPLIR